MLTLIKLITGRHYDIMLLSFLMPAMKDTVLDFIKTISRSRNLMHWALIYIYRSQVTRGLTTICLMKT